MNEDEYPAQQWAVGPTLTVQADGITDVEIRMCALTSAARVLAGRPSPHCLEHAVIAYAMTFERYLRGEDQP